jgi:hypothetical protein
MEIKVTIHLQVNILVLFTRKEKNYQGCILIQYKINRTLSILTYIMNTMIIIK